MEAKGNKQGLHYINVLNVLACLCVVGLHCNGAVHTPVDQPYWYQSLLVETLAYWAVPVFFMISGATLMTYRRRYDTKTFLIRRFSKIGIPLLIWIGFFFVKNLVRGQYEHIDLRFVLNLLLYHNVQNVYWFFAPLFAVYFAMPVLSRLTENRTTLKYMAGLGFLTISVLPFACTLVGVNFNPELTFPLTGGYVLHAVTGYLLSTHRFSRKERLAVYGLAVVGLVVRYSHTVSSFLAQGQVDKLTWGYHNWPAFFLAVAIFVFVKQICQYDWVNHPKIVSLTAWLSGASFGIYLIHAYGMMLIMNKLGIWEGFWQWRLLGPILIYGVCLLIVKLTQKIPWIGKYIFP